MLILSRRPQESLVIGNDVVVTVLGIHGHQVRLGITAPKNIVVDRAEVHARKQREYTLTPSRASPDREEAAPAAEAAIDATS
jgi:carbon storage regulator